MLFLSLPVGLNGDSLPVFYSTGCRLPSCLCRTSGLIVLWVAIPCWIHLLGGVTSHPCWVVLWPPASSFLAFDALVRCCLHCSTSCFPLRTRFRNFFLFRHALVSPMRRVLFVWLLVEIPKVSLFPLLTLFLLASCTVVSHFAIDCYFFVFRSAFSPHAIPIVSLLVDGLYFHESTH